MKAGADPVTSYNSPSTLSPTLLITHCHEKLKISADRKYAGLFEKGDTNLLKIIVISELIGSIKYELLMSKNLTTGKLIFLLWCFFSPTNPS